MSRNRLPPPRPVLIPLAPTDPRPRPTLPGAFSAVRARATQAFPGKEQEPLVRRSIALFRAAGDDATQQMRDAVRRLREGRPTSS